MAHVRIVKLRKWFPPNDPLAASVARLCILREDFAIEMQGVYQDTIEVLDSHSAEWRRIYFLRNLIRTLMEIIGAIHVLRGQAEFRAMLDRQSESVRAKFEALFEAIQVAHPLVKKIRNSICGHVQQTAVQEALENMSYDRWGFLEIGRILKQVHYKFAGEIAVEILVSGVPEDQRVDLLSSDMVKIAALFPVFELTDHVLAMYIMDRGLA